MSEYLSGIEYTYSREIFIGRSTFEMSILIWVKQHRQITVNALHIFLLLGWIFILENTKISFRLVMV